MVTYFPPYTVEKRFCPTLGIYMYDLYAYDSPVWSSYPWYMKIVPLVWVMALTSNETRVALFDCEDKAVEACIKLEMGDGERVVVYPSNLRVEP